MSFSPIVSWWLLALVGAALAAVCVLALVSRRGQRVAWTRRLLMVLALVALAAQPAGGTSTAQAVRSNLDVLVVVDNSPSVNAQDWDGTKPRLDGVRADVTALARQLDGARFALVTFGSRTKEVLPFSTDSAALVSAIDVTTPEDYIEAAGSSLDRPISLVKQILTQDRTSQPTRQRMVVLMSDGEQTVDRAPASFASLNQYVSGGAVLGYGTAKGARMRVYDSVDPNDHNYVDSPDGGDAISKADESTLRTAASQLGLPYHHRASPGDVSIALPAARSTPGTDSTSVGRPLYWIPAIALGALALWEAFGLAVRR